MTEPTIKQIKFAEQLGIPNPAQFTKEELSKQIDMRANKKPQETPQEAPGSTITGRHDIILTRIEKPHSFEFGKAGARHKVYYKDIPELQAHIDGLIKAGLYDSSGSDILMEKI